MSLCILSDKRGVGLQSVAMSAVGRTRTCDQLVSAWINSFSLIVSCSTTLSSRQCLITNDGTRRRRCHRKIQSIISLSRSAVRHYLFTYSFSNLSKASLALAALGGFLKPYAETV